MLAQYHGKLLHTSRLRFGDSLVPRPFEALRNASDVFSAAGECLHRSCAQAHGRTNIPRSDQNLRPACREKIGPGGPIFSADQNFRDSPSSCLYRVDALSSTASWSSLGVVNHRYVLCTCPHACTTVLIAQAGSGLAVKYLDSILTLVAAVDAVAMGVIPLR